MLERARRIAEGAFGTDHLEVSEIIAGQARVEHRAGRLDRSRVLWLRALDINTRVLGPDHPTVGSTHYNTACIHAVSGLTEQAIDHLELARRTELTYAGIRDDPDLLSLHGDARFESIADALSGGP